MRPALFVGVINSSVFVCVNLCRARDQMLVRIHLSVLCVFV